MATFATSPQMTIVDRLRGFVMRLLGYNQNEALEEKQQRQNQQEVNRHLNEVAALEQKTWEKFLLYSNLVVILAGGIALYVYFSISPFTSEEIAEISRQYGADVPFLRRDFSDDITPVSDAL